jgi:hypothetical protein
VTKSRKRKGCCHLFLNLLNLFRDRFAKAWRVDLAAKGTDPVLLLKGGFPISREMGSSEDKGRELRVPIFFLLPLDSYLWHGPRFLLWRSYEKPVYKEEE